MKQRTEHRWAEHRRQREEEEWQARVMVITEFDAEDTPATHAMAEAILEYRHALGVLARAVDLAKAGAPVALIGPGPRWRPRRTSDGDVVPPAA